MTAESSRKPSTEPERSPVENARLALPQLTHGMRAVYGALIEECERLQEAEVTLELDEATHRLECALEDTEKQVVAVTIERDELREDLDLVLGRKRGRLFSIERGAAAPNHCTVCDGDWERCTCESRPDPLDAELDRIVAAREPYGPFGGGEVDDDTRTAGLLADVCDAAFDDPHRAEVHGYAGILERVRELAERAKPEPEPACHDCPIGGQDGSGPVCPRADECDRECKEFVHEMRSEHGRCGFMAHADGVPPPPKPDASDDPHGLGEGWHKRGERTWVHTSGALVYQSDRPTAGFRWRGDSAEKHESLGSVRSGWFETAREAAALALGKPPVAREIDMAEARKAWDFAAAGGCTTRECVVAALHALVDELRRTGAIGGGK